MDTLVKGSVITATVQEALDNCIMVCVVHGSRTFRGVLLDEKNSLISRTPMREDVEKTIETPSDMTPQERTMVVLHNSGHNSPRRTANSRKSGLSQRLVLLNQQEEGKRSEPTIVNLWPKEDVDRAKKPKASQKRKQAGKRPMKTAKRGVSKSKSNKSMQTTGGVKRKRKNPEDCARPFKKTKGMQAVYSQAEKLSSENKTNTRDGIRSVTNIVLQPCLVKVCPINKNSGILNQSCTTTGEQTIPAPRSFLNSVIEERIAMQLNNSKRQNVHTQEVAKISGLTKLSVDLERLSSSSTHFDGVYDTAHVVDETTDTVTRTMDVDAVSEIVDILGEETDSATSVIDDDTTSEIVDILGEVTTSEIVDILSENTDTMSILNHDNYNTTSETVEETDVAMNTLNRDEEFEEVNILWEDVDPATRIVDNDRITSETADVCEKTDVTMTLMNHNEEFETVDILSEQTDPATSFLPGNELERSESVFSGKAVADRAETSPKDVSENTCPVTSDTVHAQHDESSICQNTPQSSDNDMPQALYNRDTSVKINTDPEDILTAVRQAAMAWEADTDVGENSAAIMDLPKHDVQQVGGDNCDVGLASSEHFKVVPQRSSDSEQHSNCSDISSTRLTIVVKLQPLNGNTRETNAVPQPTTQSAIGHKSPRLSVEDIVWGKVHGHPWWPGKVLTLSGTIDEVGKMLAKDASVAWFASNTISVLPVTRLSPFVSKFHKWHSPEKQGYYRIAVDEAIYAYQERRKH